jgi:hypothetical protein
MRLTADAIRRAETDEALIELLFGELKNRVFGDNFTNLDDEVRILRGLPPGLRAMGATYELDVSTTLDDLGWHFNNWHNKEYAQETLMGLRVLGASEAAEVFEQAFELALLYWEHVGDDKTFVEWYYKSPLEEALMPLNERMWAIAERSEKYRLLSYWLEYARSHPERCVAGPPPP